MKKNIFLLISFILGFWAFFYAFQNPTIYNNTLGQVSKNYQYVEENGGREKIKKPYEKLNDKSVIQWDGVHYLEIKESGYNREVDYLYAFFPLFSYIWRMLGITSVQVVFLNILMFTIGLLIFVHLFKQNWKNTVLVLCLPMIVVFFIPYTEATFFLMFSIAVWSYMKKKYWLYFVGIIMASLSRNTLLLILPAILCTEIIFLIKEKNLKNSLRRLCLGGFPVLIGTLIFSMIQYAQGSGSLFKFIDVQKYWGNKFSIPDMFHLKDWSDESFAINVPTLVMIGVPLFVYLCCILLNQMGISKRKNPIFYFTSSNKIDYLELVLLFCCLSAFISVVFFRGGSLHGLSRFVLCSPYFIILFFTMFNRLKYLSLKTRKTFFCILAFFALLILIKFLSKMGFYYLGCFIFIITVGLFLFQDKNEGITYRILLGINFLLNLIWTTYLFNMYLSNGWLFT